MEWSEQMHDGCDEQNGGTAGELCWNGARWRLDGRTLRLAIWLATHQARINAGAADCGQLWLTWKGSGANGKGSAQQAISGDLRMRL